jgi:aspartate-semialdehyde dehydrogenase
VGANGLVTESLLAVVEQQSQLSGEVILLGNAETNQTPVEFNQQTLLIEDIDAYAFDEIDILVATGELAYQGDWLERACEAGCIVLDVGGHLPGYGQSPCIVAGVNDAQLEDVARGSVVVLPDGAVVQAARLLYPLIQQLNIERVGLFSCHAVSDLGRSGVEEMARQTAQMLSGKPARPVLFSRQVAFNLLPMGADDVMGSGGNPHSGFSEQLNQILAEPDLNIVVSSCWVPVFYGHTQALHISTGQGVELETVQRILAQAPDIEAKWGLEELPTAVTEASGSDCLTLGGLSSDVKNSTEFSLWAVADNLRYGIAGNAVKIIELLVKRLFISYS